MTFVLDSALAAKSAPPPAAVRTSQGVRTASAAVPIPLPKTLPPQVRVSTPSGISAPVATTEECDAALAEGRAPVTTLSRAHLWPPNHALIDVGLTADPTAECAGLVDLDVAVWGDEADDAPTGDGVTIGDAQFDVPDLYLRAERVGGGDGRVYLVITRASTAGAEGVNCRTVVVPHSGSSASMSAVNQQAAAARATCEATGRRPRPSSFCRGRVLPGQHGPHRCRRARRGGRVPGLRRPWTRRLPTMACPTGRSSSSGPRSPVPGRPSSRTRTSRTPS